MASTDTAIAAIDTRNAEDPQRLGSQPRALVQGQFATEWLRRLVPDPSDALLLAVRAHHLRRWAIARDRYPDGRAGYLRWRRDLKAVHAAAVAEVLTPAGVDAATIARVQRLVRKDGLGTDPEAQHFEDVVCLVFLETQLEALVERLGDETKTITVLQQTLAKMSPQARALAEQARVPAPAATLLSAAVARVPAPGSSPPADRRSPRRR